MPLAHEWAVPFGRLAANHLWQSTGFAAVAVVLALALRANSARARYWLWLAASVKFLIPFSALAALGVAAAIADRDGNHCWHPLLGDQVV